MLPSVMALTSDGHRAVTGMNFGRIHIWDLEHETMIREIAHTEWGQNCVVSAVAISNDGARVLSGANDKRIRVWDVATGKCLATFVSEDFTNCACAGRNDPFVAGSRNSAIHLLELRNWEKTVVLLNITLLNFPPILGTFVHFSSL